MKMTKEERAERLLQVWLKCNGIRLFVREHVIEEQDRREGPLVEALRKLTKTFSAASDAHIIARQALAAWEALDAKPEPTLLEAAKAITTPQPFGKTISGVLVDEVMWEVLKAAVEREEGTR